jgi:hypothetical protein
VEYWCSGGGQRSWQDERGWLVFGGKGSFSELRRGRLGGADTRVGGGDVGEDRRSRDSVIPSRRGGNNQHRFHHLTRVWLTNQAATGPDGAATSPVRLMAVLHHVADKGRDGREVEGGRWLTSANGITCRKPVPELALVLKGSLAEGAPRLPNVAYIRAGRAADRIHTGIHVLPVPDSNTGEGGLHRVAVQKECVSVKGGTVESAE